MRYGSPWSEGFVRQLSDAEVRREFVADQVRARIALLIRSLREQPDRNWTQTELGERAGKPQNVISRFEDPNYGKMSLQSLLDIAAAFDLPVWIDMPSWEDWLELTANVLELTSQRAGFNAERLIELAAKAQEAQISMITAGGAASAAADAVRSMVIAPQQMPQILSSPVNTNALSVGSNAVPFERTDTAMGTAVEARNAAA